MANELIKQNYKNIANAIRSKTGKNGTLTAEKMPTEINTELAKKPTGTKSITANADNIDVATYAAVNVNVPNPSSGTLEITENGEGINVTNYAYVDVQVSGSNTPQLLPGKPDLLVEISSLDSAMHDIKYNWLAVSAVDCWNQDNIEDLPYNKVFYYIDEYGYFDIVGRNGGSVFTMRIEGYYKDTSASVDYITDSAIDLGYCVAWSPRGHHNNIDSAYAGKLYVNAIYTGEPPSNPDTPVYSLNNEPSANFYGTDLESGDDESYGYNFLARAFNMGDYQDGKAFRVYDLNGVLLLKVPISSFHIYYNGEAS